MNIIKKPSYNISENEVTPQELFNKRRSFIKLGAASLVSSGAILEALAKESLPTKNLNFIEDKNQNSLDLTSYEKITSYNNFYEFTTSKSEVQNLAKDMDTSNWEIEVSGLVEKEHIFDLNKFLSKVQLEERIYRFRCVEGWSMVVPWIGFPLKELIKQLKPLSDAKYIRFETKYDEQMFPNQGSLFPTISYPYVEGLRIDEAMNDLTIMAVGLYGAKMPNQNGAPIRLIVPWKYGFKSVKTIAKISFTNKQPINSWQKENSREYGFYANVNPNVDHPRWSQKTERVLGKFFKQKTLMFNGYEKQVAYLYKGMDLTKFI
ncbi:MAG: protein-methionine-sulfoxide reductase catalytic subunit MsrP [Campylobacterota bacterium]